jgi:hypothetical protein
MPNTEKPEGSTELQKTNGEQISTIVKKEFVPSRLMQSWLATAFELGYTASLTDIAEALKVDRGNWYKWLNKDGFVEWWDSQWQKELKRTRWRLDSIGFKKAEKSYRFWKDMQNRTGNTIPEAGNVGQQFNTQLNIADDYWKRITKRG